MSNSVPFPIGPSHRQMSDIIRAEVAKDHAELVAAAQAVVDDALEGAIEVDEMDPAQDIVEHALLSNLRAVLAKHKEAK